MLDVTNLQITFGTHVAVHGINFSIERGESLAIVGESGSGKSVSALSILGLLPKNAVAEGEILFDGQDISDWSPEKRACEGVFLSFQYPTVIPGVNNMTFLQAAVNSVRKYHGLDEFDAFDFLEIIKMPPKNTLARQRILDAAADVFASKGFHEARMDEIVAVSQTSKGAV